MEFTGKKVNGKAVFTPAVSEQRRKQWDRIKDGMTFKTSLVIPRKGKSQAQLGLIFGNLIANAVLQAEAKHITTEQMMIFLLNDAKRNVPNGVPVDKHFLHAFMYIISPTFTDDGEPVTLRDMDTEQASRLFEVTRTFLAGMGIVIDDPPEIEELKAKRPTL